MNGVLQRFLRHLFDLLAELKGLTPILVVEGPLEALRAFCAIAVQDNAVAQFALLADVVLLLPGGNLHARRVASQARLCLAWLVRSASLLHLWGLLERRQVLVASIFLQDFMCRP